MHFFYTPACLKRVLTFRQPMLIFAAKNIMYEMKTGHLDQLSGLLLHCVAECWITKRLKTVSGILRWGPLNKGEPLADTEVA